MMRHDWSPGIVQHCRNLGCPWKRRQREGCYGEATSAQLYSAERKPAWDYLKPSKKVPPCTGR